MIIIYFNKVMFRGKNLLSTKFLPSVIYVSEANRIIKKILMIFIKNKHQLKDLEINKNS